MIPEQLPLRTLQVARPTDKTGSMIFYDHVTLPELAGTISKAAGKTKSALPWVKLAVFGNTLSDKNSLRHDANITRIVGIELDYDGGVVPFTDACAAFERLGIQALAYTSPSNHGDTHRWRFLIPFAADRPVTSIEQARSERSAWIAQLEAALGVKFSRETHALSQCYYFGRTEETEFHGRLFPGPACIDELWPAQSDVVRSSRLTLAQCAEAISEGRELHFHAASMAMKLANAGKDAAQIRTAIEALVLDSGRGESRINEMLNRGELDRIVSSATQKTWHVPASDDFEMIEESPVAPGFFMDTDRLDGVQPEPPRFVIPHWLPEGAVTLYAADGGGGKSFVALDIAVRLALGMPVFGQECDPAKVMMIAAEDDEPKLHWRLSRMTDAYGHRLRDLTGRLYLRDATCDNNPLVVGSQDGRLALTARYDELLQLVRHHEPRVLILDNASDMFAANENDRAQVRSFITKLNVMAKEMGGAVLLLAHVNAQTVKDPNGAKTYSGSTAWSNSVRSRWYQWREEDGRMALRLDKSNYAKAGLAVPIKWDEFLQLFVVGDTVDARNPDLALVRSMLLELIAAGGKVDRAQKANNNPLRLLRRDSRLPPGVGWAQIDAVIHALLDEGLIVEVAVPTGRKAKKDWPVRLQMAASTGGDDTIHTGDLLNDPTLKGHPLHAIIEVAMARVAQASLAGGELLWLVRDAKATAKGAGIEWERVLALLPEMNLAVEGDRIVRRTK